METKSKKDRLQMLIRMRHMLQQQISKIAREIANTEKEIEKLQKEIESESE